MMTQMFELELVFRIALAGMCGVMIGFERMNRLKEAGIKTHTVVALGSALIMVVSKYGFVDIFNEYGVVTDAARVAAQIVTGVGFLGAGMILIKKQTVSGLTTAAIIWTTSGIGMTIGAGLYLIGIASTLLLLGFQFIFHSKLVRRFEKNGETILLETEDETVENILDIFHKHKIAIHYFRASRTDHGIIEIEIMIGKMELARELIKELASMPSVKHIEY